MSEVAEPRDAATVLLLRSTAEAPLEVFVMVRRTTMEFAAGVVVFPGGGVDAADSPSDSALLTDESRDGHDVWAARMGATDLSHAASVLGAAVREVAEETGVVLSPDALGLWDAWTTPVVMPKRYRTWFFTALLPPGQEARELSTESSSVSWVTPAEALDKVDAGEWDMMPPTYAAMLRLATFASAGEVMAATVDASVEMFLPDWTDASLRLPVWAQELAAARGDRARWS
ncbi:NUDIX hydrolase [Nocardioides sp. Kera G14]|uniref:NUDIX hydrolase n=1 Tax=Nocardioides sp. Kera G14 TaxID=2884264 RepID=UPI001D12AEDF|nr:NUDIX hydrolase [Nocardioides sp. Kera G14]UDY23748.1 NUDIX hydrolase [Nocardioides sp. Kera G14]